MITGIRGSVREAGPGKLVLETATGLFMELQVPVSSYEDFQGKAEVYLHTVLKFRDDEFILYGFRTQKERMVFSRLTKISGVGGKTALSMISAFSINEMAQIIENGDVVRLSSVPGIGKKTAQRIVLELTGKLRLDDEAESAGQSVVFDELVSGLVNLGYSAKNAAGAVKAVMKDSVSDSSFQELFKKVLKRISRL